MRKSLTSVSLPPFDRAESTRTLCIVSLALSWAASIACLTLSVHAIVSSGGGAGSPLPLPGVYRDVLPLVLNIFVALHTESLGYIHSVSLRWSLWKEGRLGFNSSSRLFTSSRSIQNSWYVNILWAICLVFSFSGASQLFILAYNADLATVDPLPGGSDALETLLLNYIALGALSIGILGQAIISTWSVLGTWNHVLTWSSNPLNTALACLQNGLSHRTGRCMRDVTMRDDTVRDEHSAVLPDIPLTRPKAKQPSAQKADRSVRHTVRFTWVLVALTVIWGVLVRHFTYPDLYGNLDDSLFNPSNFSPLDNTDLDIRPFKYSDDVSRNPGIALQYTYWFLVVAAIQSFQTLGLHSVELLANLSRDESTWRRASLASKRSAPGTSISSSAFQTAVTSWQTVALFVLKPIIHWLFGLSIATYRGAYYSVSGLGTETAVAHYVVIIMRFVPIFTLAGAVFLLAVLATLLALWSPRGPQPAAYGYVQTLADLVDTWYGGAGAKMWWGDKGLAGSNVRHAGTSDQQEMLGIIRMTSLYS